MTTINAKTKARIRKYSGTYNDSKDGTVREVDLEVGCTYEQTAKAFGERLAEAVFAGYVAEDDETTGEWRLSNPKPSKRVVCPNHNVKLDGDGFVVQPQIRGFRTVEDTEKVVAVIRLRLGQAQVALRKKLEERVGEDINVEFEPTEMELPLGQTSNLSDRQMEIVPGGASA